MIIIALVGINIAIFIRGIEISDEIHYFESELQTLKQENIESEQEIYKMTSYTRTASLAAELSYGSYNEPMYRDLPQYALKQ